MVEIIANFFSIEFAPQDRSLLWIGNLVWLNVWSEALIALTYYSMPLALLHLMRKRQVMLPVNLCASLAVFLVWCGAVHMMEIWRLLHGIGPQAGAIRLSISVIGLMTGVVLLRAIPRIPAHSEPQPSPAAEASQPGTVVAANAVADSSQDIEAIANERGITLAVIRDLTDRRRVEQVLRLQAVIVKNMAEGVCLVRDGDQAIVYTNPKFDGMFGYAAGELHGKSLGVLTAATGVSDVRKMTSTVLDQSTTRGEATYEARQVKKDGTTLWCRVHTSKLDHPEFGLVWVAVHEDITARKQAEAELQKARNVLELKIQQRTAALAKANSNLQAEISKHIQTEKALRVSEERLRLAMEIGQMGTWDWDFANDRVTLDGYFSHLLSTILPTTKASYEHFLRIVHPDDRDKMQKAFDRAREEGIPYNEEFRLCRSDGRTVWTVSQSQTYRDETGRVTRMISLLQDFTERKLAEMSLRESEERFQAVIANMTEGLVISDLDGHLLHWNPAALAMHGFSSSAEWQLHLPVFMDIFELSEPDGPVLAFEQWPLPRLFRGEQVQNHELRIRRLDAAWERVFSYSGAIVREPSGRQVAFLTISDITERFRAEAEVRRHVEQLHASNEELERFNRATAGRELRMIELKNRINELSRRFGQPPPYPLDFINENGKERT